MLRFFFLCALLLFCTITRSQDFAKKTDSVNAKLRHLKGPELNKAFNDQSGYLSKLPKEQAFVKAEAALREAQNSTEPFAVFLAMRNLSRLCLQHQQQRQALQYMQDGLAYAKEKADSFTLALTYFHTAEFYKQQQLLATALENLLQASALFDGLGDHRYVASCKAIAADIHYGARNFIQAIEDCEQVVSHYEKIPASKRTGEDDFQLMSTNNTLGLSYYKAKQYDKSLASYSTAEVMARQINNEFWIGLINGNRAGVYREVNLFDKALESLQMDYRISKKFNESESASRAASSMAEIYLQQQNVQMAEKYLDSSRLMANSRNRFDVSAYLLVSAKIKKEKGDLTGAFEDLEQYNALRDSVIRQSEALNLTKVKASYELERKQQEIEELAQRNQQDRDRIRFQNLVIITTTIIVILLILIVIVYVLNLNKLKKTNQIIKRQHGEIEYKNEELEAQSAQLREANELAHTLNTQLEEKVKERTQELEAAVNELDTFLYRSSHDMRRPLSTLLGLENIAKLQTQDPKVLQLFEMVADTVRHMDGMLLKLQMAYELEQQKVEWETFSVSALLADQVEKFRKRMDNGAIILENKHGNIQATSSPKLLTIVFKNLLENAVQFRQQRETVDPHIIVQLDVRDDQLQIIFTDNGIGIDAQYITRVFDQYFKGTELSKGNGLGLYLVKKAVDKLNGCIEVRSEEWQGTTFTVTLPLT